jgi:SAM-dependent methyltransferase
MESFVKYSKKYSSFKYLNCYESEVDFFGFQFKTLQKMLNEYDFSQLSCFDIGCGFGIKTYYISEIFERVIGADFIENIISVNNLLNDRNNLEFIPYDFTKNLILNEKFDCVTAFGFSILNTSDVTTFVKNVDKIMNLTNNKGFLIIWSFSDFTSKSPSGWHNHSKNELKEIVSCLKKNYPNVDLIFPHNKIIFEDFFSFAGFKRIIRVFLKKKYYFLIIKK